MHFHAAHHGDTHYFSARTRLRSRTLLAAVIITVLLIDVVGVLIVDSQQSEELVRVSRLEAHVTPSAFELVSRR